MRHPLTVHERPAAGPVEAVIFDWGGTLTPWHSIDLGEQWRVFAREIHGIPFASEDVPPADLERAADAFDGLSGQQCDAVRLTLSTVRSNLSDLAEQSLTA